MLKLWTWSNILRFQPSYQWDISFIFIFQILRSKAVRMENIHQWRLMWFGSKHICETSSKCIIHCICQIIKRGRKWQTTKAFNILRCVSWDLSLTANLIGSDTSQTFVGRLLKQHWSPPPKGGHNASKKVYSFPPWFKSGGEKTDSYFSFSSEV